jgi:sporadic carbohydrate cluster protein (TIGR04323 family)
MAYRGYIFSREFMSERVPQHIQNLVIRDYCKNNDLEYLLHATEYGMRECFLIFNQLLEELNQVDGIITYSMFQLPINNKQREIIFSKIINQKKSIHFAVEKMKVSNKEELQRVENIWNVKKISPYCLNKVI